MPTSPPNSSPSSKPNPTKSFKIYLLWRYRFLISNPSKYYKDVEWKTLIKKNFLSRTIITIIIVTTMSVSSRRNSAIFRFKPSPKQISSIDNVLSSPSGEVDISLLATSPDSDIQFDQYNTDKWKEM
ncbi:unnamed protein product [Rhizophagus irregularis]|nr:unnamed protein product [Rhizophagus irregularis]